MGKKQIIKMKNEKNNIRTKNKMLRRIKNNKKNIYELKLKYR